MYFNFSSRTADDWLGRRAFLHTWWRSNARDRRWTPPPYTFLYQAVVARKESLLAARNAAPLTVEAVVRPAQNKAFGTFAMPMGMGDSIVAQGLALNGAGRAHAEAYIALLSVANDADSLERLLDAVWQHTAQRGALRVVAPAELAPAFSAGLLLDNFHLSPPLHTPYNAPYLPDLLDGVMEPLRASRLWHMATAQRPALPQPPRGLEIAPFDAARLALDLLPLLHAALPPDAASAPPAADEVDFALRLWAVAPLRGLLACLDGAPVGFVLMQPDMADVQRRMRGGRPLWARAARALRPLPQVAAGRILLGAVLPQARGRGVGRHLLSAAQVYGEAAGWRTLAIGPVAEQSAATRLLAAAGAAARQSYALYVQGE